MLKDVSTDNYRRLLEELQAGIAARLQAERELSGEGGTDELPAASSPDRALRALTDEFEQSVAAADQQLEAERKRLEEQFLAEEADIRTEFDGEASDIALRYDDERSKVEKKYREDSWMVSSILDDKSESSPKFQLEKLRTALSQTRDRMTAQTEEVQAGYEQAVALVERRRQRVSEGPTPGAAPRNREDAFQAFTAAALQVSEGLERLKRQTLPRLFAGWAFLALALVLWAGLAAVLFFVVEPQWVGFKAGRGLEWALLSGGAALGVCGIGFLVCYDMAGRQTAAVLEPLQQGAVDAQAHFQTWQKLAKIELARCEQESLARYAAVVERRDRSLGQFAAARDEQVYEIEARRAAELETAERRQMQGMQVASERYNQQLLAAESIHRRDTTALRTRFERDREAALRQHEQQSAERAARRAELERQSAAAWSETLERAAVQTQELLDASRLLFPEWAEIADAQWRPADQVPPGIHIGNYEIALADFRGGKPLDGRYPARDEPYLLPAVLPFPEFPSLILKASGAGRGAAVSVLQTAMLRLLTQLPPGDVRFTIIDPIGLGENFAAFMHLADYDELLISTRIWTEPAHIDQQLANLTEHMENVFQKYLRNEFATIEEYNASAGEVAEPYRILIVANFPAGFSERAAQRLVSIITSGPRCGVYTLASVDTRLAVPHGCDLSHLEDAANLLEWQGGRLVTRNLGPEPVPLAVAAPPPAPLFAALIRKLGELSKDVRRVEVPFHRIVPREDAWWTGDSRSAIDVPLGRAGATKLQHLRLGPGTSQHVLVAGKTGSGKSTLLHVVVTNLALRYSPDEVEFYLIDFKKGVEFKTYAAHRLPHARVIAIESDREFGTSVLERLDTILKERGDLFRHHGVQDIASYRDACPDARLPRILLIVDEFQEFFVEDDRYSQTAALLLDRLVRQGRAFGIHVLLGSQTLGGAYSLARTTIGQMAVRIALQCSEADAHLILSEDNTAARLLTRPGEAIYNDANGMFEGNNPFQIAWLNDDERDRFLERAQHLAEERGGRWPEAIVFEGNIPADPARNPDLCGLIEAAAARQPLAGFDPAAPRAWVGEAVAITGPTSVTFARRSGANLLVVGGESGPALGILANVVVALSAGAAVATDLPAEAAGARVYLLAGDSDAANRKRWGAVAALFPQSVTLAGPEQGAALVAELAAEVARRQSETAAANVFLVIDDLSRFRQLRKSDDDYGFGGFGKEKQVSPGQAFGEVLKDGPAVGVHVVAWCDSYNNVDRWFSRQSLREFEMRAVFQMSAADSSNLVDSPAASRLGTNRALLYSDERGTIEKFRPYGAPADAWLAWLRERLAATGADGLDVADDIDQWVVM